MTNTATANVTEAAAALVLQLPTARVLTATRLPSGATVDQDRSGAIAASFVGAVSADVALMLGDSELIAEAAGTDSAMVSVADVLRPALEAATAVFGAGVLGGVSADGDRGVFDDPASALFQLATDTGTPAGWFGIRVREPAPSQPIIAAEGSVADKLGRISNVEMAMTVEIGRTRMSVRDVLNLEPGGVVELDSSAGAPADILLNGRLIAHGEIVVVDQDYAVRITEIIDVNDGLS